MNKLLFIGVAAAAFMMLLATSSCQYKFIVEPAIEPPPPGDTISFSLDIVPIWSEQGCTGCHSTGGQSPDLTPDNAYNSLMSTGLVSTDDPESSKIYYYPLATGTHYAKYDTQQAADVLWWITDGAKDN
jgi:hypothetical protein